jgi:serine/threonine protein kinase
LEAAPPIGKVIKVQSLRCELEKITDPSVSAALIDFIESLLIVDLAKRPTAEQALQHPYLK